MEEVIKDEASSDAQVSAPPDDNYKRHNPYADDVEFIRRQEFLRKSGT